MNKELIKSCQDCCLKGQFQNGQWGCILTQKPIDLEKDYCSRGCLEVSHCSLCGQPLIKYYHQAFAIQKNNIWQLYCENCYNRV